MRDDKRTRVDEARESAIRTYSIPLSGGILPISIPRYRTRPTTTMSFFLLFRNEFGRNILTPQSLARMKSAEDTIFNHPKHKKFCLVDILPASCSGEKLDCPLPKSILNSRHLYGVYNKENRLCGRKSGSNIVSDAQYAAFLKEVNAGKHDVLLGDDLRNTTVSLIQTVFPVGLPFPGFDRSDSEDVQSEEYDEWTDDMFHKTKDMSTSELDIYMYGLRLSRELFSKEVYKDLAFSGLAILLVFVVLWLHTGSAFLAGIAMAQIFMSFPLAYVIYSYVLQQKYFSGLQVFAVFLLLGIGADDVFVFTDAWKQAALELGPDCDIENRMITAYRRAVRAMTVTSLTTAAAFFITANSPIMPVSTFGVWAGILILVQFSLIISAYPCALVLWQKHIRGRICIVCVMEKPESEEEMPKPFWITCLPQGRLREYFSKQKQEDGHEHRILEQFFHGPWVNGVQRIRVILTLISAIIIGVSLYFCFQLEGPSEEQQLLADDHPITRARFSLSDDFGSGNDDRLYVQVTWGIKDINRAGTSRFKTGDLGAPILDEAFDLKPAASQRHIFNVCKELRQNKKLVDQRKPPLERVRCWIEEFVKWRRKNGRTGFQDYNSDSELVLDIISFATEEVNGEKRNLQYITAQDVMFSSDFTKVISSEIRIFATGLKKRQHKDMWVIYSDWQKELKRLGKQGPPATRETISNADYYWIWQITQREIEESVLKGVGAMLAVTTVVLSITTLNIATSIIATIALVGVISSLLACVYLIGWELGVIESVSAVLSIGYSFDGIAHITTAYSASKETDRFSRTRDALTELGISIVFGIVSTMLSAAMLLPATVLLFKRLSILILMTMSHTALWSFVFLPAMLLTFGPQGNFLSLRPIVKRVLRSKEEESFSDWTNDTSEPRISEELPNNNGRTDKVPDIPSGSSVIKENLEISTSLPIAEIDSTLSGSNDTGDVSSGDSGMYAKLRAGRTSK